MSAIFSEAAGIRGFIGALLVDVESGLVLVATGGSTISVEAVATFGIQVVEAMLQNLRALGVDERIAEILITMGQQVHIIHPVEKAPGVLFYVCLNRQAARVGMARVQVRRLGETLVP